MSPSSLQRPVALHLPTPQSLAKTLDEHAYHEVEIGLNLGETLYQSQHDSIPLEVDTTEPDWWFNQSRE